MAAELMMDYKPNKLCSCFPFTSKSNSQLFMDEIVESLLNILAPNERPLDPAHQEILSGLVWYIAEDICKEIKNSENVDQLAMQQLSGASQLLLDRLIRDYSDGTKRLTDISAVDAFGIGTLLDTNPVSLMKALQMQGLHIVKTI